MHPSKVAIGQALRVSLTQNASIFVKAVLSQQREGVMELRLESSTEWPQELTQMGAPINIGMTVGASYSVVSGECLGLNDGLLHVAPKGEFRTQQLRQFFRATFGEKVQLRVLKSADKALNGKFEEAMALDLSAGGMQVSCHLALRVSDAVHIQFPLGPEIDKRRPVMAIEGVVRRCVPARQAYTLGVQFKELPMKDQDRLVAFLLKRQKNPS